MHDKNPFSDVRPLHDCTVVILGATGDLSKRKLFPALYSLLQKKRVQKLRVVGAAFQEATVAEILGQAHDHVEGHVDEIIWQELVDCTSYQQLDFTKADDFFTLARTVYTLEKEHNMSGNRLIYCAAAAHFFCNLTENIAASGLAQKKERGCAPWHRIIYEKPFGHNLASAHEINACIAAQFEEHQIYRIDHYLTKELVSNLALIRFTNAVFEPIWDNRSIDNVQIVLSERIGIGQRGAYYDHYGALRDVVQNHMLELLALIAMEAPEKLVGNYVRDERAQVLKKLSFVDGILGQYEGYTNEPGVAHDSTTETFAALYLQVDNPRWSGVPFFIKTGKCLDKQETVIHITFKKVDCRLAENCHNESNVLTIKISPEELFTLTLNARKPGTQQELIGMPMEYCHSCRFGAITPPAYTVLLDEVMRGEQSVSVRFDEIEYEWQLIDTIEAKKLPVALYKKGSDGPTALKEFEKKYGMRWYA